MCELFHRVLHCFLTISAAHVLTFPRIGPKIKNFLGEVIGVSKKFVIDQRINDIFSAVIENLDPMHNDPGWANASPFGSTIVYGYLQLSLAAMIWKDIGMYEPDV